MRKNKTEESIRKTRKDFLVFGKPFIGQEEINEVVSTLKSGWWGTGPRVEKFENEFKDYIGSKYALAVSSATAGLHLSLKVLGVGPGDEVITTPMTFCSTANVILHCGATPVFADVDFHDWNIDPEEIEKKITKKTKVIMPVHLHGRSCQMDKIMALAKKYKLYVVEDAAHAIETKFQGRKIGNIGDLTVFSFYVTKNLATGEGGMVTTNNQEWAEKIKAMSLHGLSRDAYKRYSVNTFHHYQAIMPGYKYNMMDIQAAIGLHQLARIKENSLLRKKYWQMYIEAFKNISELILPQSEEEGNFHGHHLFAILVRPEKLKIDRDEFISELIKNNIGSGVHFYPVHLHPYYQKTFGYKKGDFPKAEFIGERTISLPLGANLTEKDVNDVIKTINQLISKYRKNNLDLKSDLVTKIEETLLSLNRSEGDKIINELTNLINKFH
jgi:dTDP-4-amino-4,6-dideoxygalactose transaminase